jgi:hypothetical protein
MEPTVLSLLVPPPADADSPLHSWWSRTLTLRTWVNELTQLSTEAATITATTVSGETVLPGIGGGVSDSLSPLEGPYLGSIPPTPAFAEASWELFYENQRARWMAFKAFNKWRWNVWRKRPQCGVDLIMNEPVESRDAIFLTDTRNKAVYCFHRRDLFTNLMTKITAADEMLPTPRPPTNPWTNQPLTLGQTLAVCQALLQHSVSRGRCPPTLFAAFCAAGYSLSRFESENSSLLAQYAITAYFKDLHEHNRETVTDTMLELLRDAGQRYSAVAVRRWLRITPVTAIHREWLALVRDYTLHMNLHIQPRRHWYHDVAIYGDVRELFRRTPMEDPAGPRLRLLRATPGPSLRAPVSLAIGQLFETLGTLDLSENVMTTMPMSTTILMFDASGNPIQAPPVQQPTISEEEAAVTALLSLLHSTMNQ